MGNGFKRETAMQKAALKSLNEAVGEYLKLIELPYGVRHRKTTMVFVGDRFKPVSIVCRYVKQKGGGDV